MKYIDTHCHLLSEYFDDTQIVKLINTAREFGVKEIIIPATTWENSLETIKISQKYPYVYSAIGVHPSVATNDFDANLLTDIDVKKIIAIGEIGLDFYWENNPLPETQIHVFKIFLDFAIKHDLPALIHMRNSEQEIYNILSMTKYKRLKFLIHSFTSTYEWACKFIELGGLISFSGIVTFKNAKNLQEVVKKIPLNKILSETDTPYLTPTPHRGQSNQPAYVKHVVDFIASLREEKSAIVVKTIYKNTKTFFNF